MVPSLSLFPLNLPLSFGVEHFSEDWGDLCTLQDSAVSPICHPAHTLLTFYRGTGKEREGHRETQREHAFPPSATRMLWVIYHLDAAS